jgi:hypothetical protein
MVEVGRHLGLEQAAQDLEVLARRLADARPLEPVDGLVELAQQVGLHGAQRGLALAGRLLPAPLGSCRLVAHRHPALALPPGRPQP